MNILPDLFLGIFCKNKLVFIHSFQRISNLSQKRFRIKQATYISTSYPLYFSEMYLMFKWLFYPFVRVFETMIIVHN